MMHLTEDQIYHLVEAIGNHETLTAEEEQQMEGQMSIDDILTGAAEEPKQSPVRHSE